MNIPLSSPTPEGAHGVKSLQQSKDTLVADLKVVIADAQLLMKEAVAASSEGISAVPAYLEDRLSAVKYNFNRAKDTVGSTARHAAAATDTYVRQNPWRSLGIACAASIFAGLLLAGAGASVMGKFKGK